MKKINIYRLLGAEKFQYVVFGLERLKFHIMHKIPNIEGKMDYLIDKEYNFLTRIHKDKKEELEQKRKFAKMHYRKELYTNENNNYHCNMEYPIEFIRQLEFNKDMHVKALTMNIGALLALLVGNLIFTIALPITVLFTIYQIVSMIINFECINLQNYNLERFNNERTKANFTKKTIRSYQSNYKKFSHASEKIEKLVKNSSTIPTVSDTINCMETQEEREELLAMAQKQKKRLTLKRREQ